MKARDLTREAISREIKKVKKSLKEPVDTVRILFSPTKINEDNLKEAAKIYGRIGRNDFDTVVVIESTPGEGDKKIPMSSHKFYKTTLGKVQADDRLRNDFCDEDDDFFIDDEAFEEDLSLFDQLNVLQCVLEDFTALSIQITDEGNFIVKELANALEEILISKNALIVVCCDLPDSDQFNPEKIWEMVKSGNQSGLLNFLNSDKDHPRGIGSFVAGLLVAKSWGLNLKFESDPENSYFIAYAEMQKHAIFG